MEINIFSWLEVKNKIYKKHLQTVDGFFSDMKLIPEWAPVDELTDEDVITVEDYNYLSEFLLWDRVKSLQMKVSRDYPKEDYEVLYEILGTPHYNIYIWVQLTPFERKLLPLPEWFVHPWKPNAVILAMNQFDKTERLRKSMGKLNKNVGDSWWYNYNYWTGTIQMPSKLKTGTSSKTEITEYNRLLKKQKDAVEYDNLLRQTYNLPLNGKQELSGIGDYVNKKEQDIKPSTSYAVKLDVASLSSSLKINHL